MISHHIQYKGEAVLDDVLQLKTYVTTSEGVKSTRIVDIYNKTTQKATYYFRNRVVFDVTRYKSTFPNHKGNSNAF